MACEKTTHTPFMRLMPQMLMTGSSFKKECYVNYKVATLQPPSNSRQLKLCPQTYSNTDTNTNASLLTDVFTYSSYVWQLYSSENHGTRITFCYILVKSMFPSYIRQEHSFSDFSLTTLKFLTFPGLPDVWPLHNQLLMFSTSFYLSSTSIRYCACNIMHTLL